MMVNTLKAILLSALLAAPVSTQAIVLYSYDFPGSPGSGVAADQTNSQPANATFSDFTRHGTLQENPRAGVFNNDNWPQTPTLDPTSYVAYTVTANAGFGLALTQITFDANRKNNGPADVEIDLYLNGSATPYASMGFNPTDIDATYTFDFTDLTAADNVTTAEVRLFGWNATAGNGGELRLDNFTTSGAIVIVPEPSTWLCAIFALAIAGHSLLAATCRYRLLRRR